jgi:MFS superfamily sulfate permease-like transporter
MQGYQTSTNPWSNLVHDGPASLVVFFVALPLCMGVAIASGVPPAAGLITGIVGGLVVGWLSGSPMQVSGPAAGLIVLVYDLVATRGVRALAVVLLLAGLMQLAAGVLRLAPWFRAVAPAVIVGMLAGIGALILVGQLHVMMDVSPMPDGLSNLLTLPDTVWRAVNPDESFNHHRAAFVGVLTILIILVWQAFLQKRVFVPGTLVAVLVASFLAVGMGWQIRYVVVPADFTHAIRLLQPEDLRPAFAADTAPALWIEAVVIAVIASAESLLCATAVDRLHQGPRTQYDRELIAQGIGNMICALLGGLPMTGVIVRSSANVYAGARTRASAILHGFWILVVVMFLPWLLSFVPVACLAGILVYTGFKLIDLHAVRNLWRVGKGEAFICLATFAVIVAEDLLTGVLVGVALSGVKLLFTFSRLKVRMESDTAQKRTTLLLEGAATFLRLPKLAESLERVPAGHELHVHFERLTYIDHACMDLLTSWAKQHEAQGGRLVIDWDSLHARFDRTRAPKGFTTVDAESTEKRQKRESTLQAPG